MQSKRATACTVPQNPVTGVGHCRAPKLVKSMYASKHRLPSGRRCDQVVLRGGRGRRSSRQKALPTQPGTRPAGTGEIRRVQGVVNESAPHRTRTVANTPSIAVTDWRTPKPARELREQPLHAEEAITVQSFRNPLALIICAFARVQLLPPHAAQALKPCSARVRRTDPLHLFRFLSLCLVRPSLG